MSDAKTPDNSEIIVTADGQPVQASDAAATSAAPNPQLQQEIEAAKTELGNQSVSGNKTIGTHNALVFNLKVREVFRTIYVLLIAAALIGAAYFIWHSGVRPATRLRLLTPAATSLALSLLRLKLQPTIAIEAAVTFIVILFAWYKSRSWVIANLLTRLIFLVFWTLAAWWLFNVLALGQVAPVLPLVRGLN